jgi:hypothetical protein
MPRLPVRSSPSAFETTTKLSEASVELLESSQAGPLPHELMVY